VIGISRGASAQPFSSDNYIDADLDLARPGDLERFLTPGSSLIAALPSGFPGLKKPSAQEYLFDSEDFLQRMFRVAENAGVARFFFCSSGGAVYGNSSTRPFSEDVKASPISEYGMIKKRAEDVLLSLSQQGETQAIIWRIANAYGPGQGPAKGQGLIPSIVTSLLRNEPVPVMGDGSMIRDYIYVRDIGRIGARMVTERLHHAVYNLGTGVGHSVGDVVNIVARLLKQKIEVRRVGKPASFVDYSVLDTTRLRAGLPGLTLTSFEDGLRDFLASSPQSFLTKESHP
jgi:nucleoside-diphosphate-sugar epimerase